MSSNLRIYAAHLVPVLVLALSCALLFVHAPHLLEGTGLGTGLLRWILVSITLSWLLWYSACRILRPIKQEARDWVRSVHSVVGIAYASLVLALAWDFRAAPAHTVRYPEDELLTLDYVSSRIVSHERARLSIVRDGTRVNAPSSRIVCVADEYGATPTEVAELLAERLPGRVVEPYESCLAHGYLANLRDASNVALLVFVEQPSYRFAHVEVTSYSIGSCSGEVLLLNFFRRELLLGADGETCW